MDQPFPNKPVIHRRSQRTQGPLTLHEFEKRTLSTQQRGHFSPEDYNSNGFQETKGSLYSREDSHRLPNRELQIARAIHAKELMLQGKLWKVGEKIRQTIESQSADTAENDQQKGGEERQYRAQAETRKVQTKVMLSEHEKRQPGRRRDTLVDDASYGNFKQKINKQAKRTEDRMRINPKVQQARWEGEETLQSKDEGQKGVRVINDQKINEVTKTLQEMNKYSRRKEGNEKSHVIWEKSEIKDSKQREPYLNNTDWTKEKNYRERTHRKTYSDQQEVPWKSLEKSAHRRAAENHDSLERKLSKESTLSLVSSSSHCSPQQQVDEPVISIPDNKLQLLPCGFCHRTFRSERLEKHTQICKSLKQSQRQVYNSSFHRTKGSQVEEFFKTHIRSKTPEFSKKKKKR